MEINNIDLEKLYSTLYKLKFALSQTKPITYAFLKPYIQKKIDVQVSMINEKAQYLYEAILSDEMLLLIAQQKDFKLSYKFYNTIIIDVYKDKLYLNLPLNHPLKSSNRIMKYVIICAVMTILLFLISNHITEQTIVNSFLASGLSIIIAIITKKMYLFTVFVAPNLKAAK